MGLSLTYAVQPEPGGLAQAYHIGADFVGTNPSTLILGDNIFYGHGLTELLDSAAARESGALVLAFVTLPFNCEGNRRQSQAQQALVVARFNPDVPGGLHLHELGGPPRAPDWRRLTWYSTRWRA